MAGIKQINAESESEIRLINEIAIGLNKTVSVGIRVNPDVDARTHEKITTGKKENKFGIDWNDARRLFLSAEQFKGLSLHGIEVHVGSQILELSPFREAFVKTKKMLNDLKEHGVSIQTVDVGGGLGVSYVSGRFLSLFDTFSVITFLGSAISLAHTPGRINFLSLG